MRRYKRYVQMLLLLTAIAPSALCGAENNSLVDDVPVEKKTPDKNPVKPDQLVDALGKHTDRPAVPVKVAHNPDPLDAATALKAAGWTKITGAWKKNAEGVYEVTGGGSLEAAKAEGALRFSVVKGGGSGGEVRAFVRNSFKVDTSAKDKDDWATGFGLSIDDKAFRLYTPYAQSGALTARNLKPHLERETKLPTQNARNEFEISIQGKRLEITVNGKREKLANYELTAAGPFIVEVAGTVTLENPQAVGK